MRLRDTLLLGLVLLVPCAQSAMAQNLVTNGDFSTLASWSVTGPGITGWGGGGTFDSFFSIVDPAPPAGTMAFISQGGPASISQNITTLVSGGTYKWSFSLAASSTSGSFVAAVGDQTLEAYTSTSPSGTQASNPAGAGYAWQTYSGSFTYDGVSNLLDFSANVPAGSFVGYYMTNVTITSSTPPPPTLLATLAGGALGGLRMLRARRRKTA